MDEKRIQCLSNASRQVPIYPVIQHVSSKVRQFSTFLHILTSPEYAPVLHGWNSGQTHSSIYPSIFNRLRGIARYWSEIATFFLPLAFNVPVGGVTIGIPGKGLVPRKLESMYYQEWRQFDDRLSRFDTIPACDGQTDGQIDGRTDKRPAYINNVRSMTDAR